MFESLQNNLLSIDSEVEASTFFRLHQKSLRAYKHDTLEVFLAPFTLMTQALDAILEHVPEMLYPLFRQPELRIACKQHHDIGVCRYGAFDDYDEEDHILFQQNQGVGKKHSLYPICFEAAVCA